MKKSNIYLFSLFMIFVIPFIACKKKDKVDPRDLPVILTAKMNGNDWASVGSGGADFFHTGGDFYIHSNGSDTSFYLSIRNAELNQSLKGGRYDVGSSNEDARLICHISHNENGDSISSYSSESGNVYITHIYGDAADSRVSGKFEGFLRNSSTVSSDSIIITDGIFTNIEYGHSY